MSRKLVRVERVVSESDDVTSPWVFHIHDRLKKFDRLLSGKEVEEAMGGKRLKFFFITFKSNGDIVFAKETYEQDWS